jgi:uncharacterized protein with beta-barrel porin domain
MRGGVSTGRTITLGGGALLASGDTHVTVSTVSAEGARRFELGGGFGLTALARTTGSDVKQDAYVERGAGGLSLAVGEVNRRLYVGELGVQLKRTFEHDGNRLEPYVGIGAAAAGGDRAGAVSVAFTGAPTGTGAFTVVGAELPPTWSKVNAGVELTGRDGFVVKLGYEGAYSDRLNENLFAARIGWTW